MPRFLCPEKDHLFIELIIICRVQDVLKIIVVVAVTVVDDMRIAVSVVVCERICLAVANIFRIISKLALLCIFGAELIDLNEVLVLHL